MFHTTKYVSEDFLGMKTKVSTVKGTKDWKVQTVEALADSGASIISWYLAKKVNMMIFEKGDATLKDASHNNMDMSGRGDIMVQEEHGIKHKIKVLVSTECGCMLLMPANTRALQGGWKEAGAGPARPTHHREMWSQQEQVLRPSSLCGKARQSPAGTLSGP